MKWGKKRIELDSNRILSDNKGCVLGKDQTNFGVHLSSAGVIRFVRHRWNCHLTRPFSRFRETMESMLAEQHYLRSPLRPFDLDQHNNNLTLEEKAILAARSQLFLRAAYPLYGVPAAALWGQWACLAPQLLAQQHLASGSGLQLPRPVYPGGVPAGLSQHRFSPYPPRRSSPGSSPDSIRDASPHPLPPHPPHTPHPPHSPT